jgi:ABC-2 type transport system permease protein
MKRFLGFLKKEFYHIFRDKRTLLILFGMPVAQILLFGFAITNEIKNAKIGIYDQSHDFMTQKITAKLLSSGYFLLEEKINNQQSIQRSFEKGKIKEVIIFEADFAKNLIKNGTANIQLIADATDPNTANALVSYTTAIINDYQQGLNINKQMPMVIIPEVKMMFNPELKGVFMFVPGVITIILMLVSAMMTSISIAREKELGTMEVLMVSPLRPLPIILGKVIPYLILSFINASVILLLGKFVFGMPMQGNIFLLLFE